MILVSVSGACSRSGKTALAETLLRAAPGASAVKFTTTDDVFLRCPRGTACLVCDIDVPFRIVREDEVLRQPGTDTDRLAAAGAARVLWAIAKAGAAGPAWAAVRALVADEAVVVLEGSTVVARARPDLRLFVVHPFLSPARWKPTSPALIAEADAVVVNRKAAEPREPQAEVLAEVARHRGKDDVRVADVTRPLASWAPDLADRVRAWRPRLEATA